MAKQDIMAKFLLVMMFKKGVNISKTKKILWKFADVKIAYILYIVGSYGRCEHWNANSQDIFDLNYCGYAKPCTPKERGGEK